MNRTAVGIPRASCEGPAGVGGSLSCEVVIRVSRAGPMGWKEKTQHDCDDFSQSPQAGTPRGILLVAKKVHELAATMPGFIGQKSFTAEDGGRVSIVEFASEETRQAWREHPGHRVA